MLRQAVETRSKYCVDAKSPRSEQSFMSDDPVIRMFSETLDVPAEELNDETSPDTTSKWDSRRSMELVALIEETFDVELTTKEIMKMRSIGIVREVLRAKGVEGV